MVLKRFIACGHYLRRRRSRVAKEKRGEGVMSKGLDGLQHIVVLVMENRSFDHMLGFAQSSQWGIDGLTGQSRSNKDSTGKEIATSNDANYAGDLTPDP